VDFFGLVFQKLQVLV